jgi:hypothetical protein
MKDSEFALVAIAVLIATACVFGAIGSQMGRDQMYDRCFENHKDLTIIEARKTCDAILKK